MDDTTFYRLQPGDTVSHGLTPWKEFMVVSVKERKPGTRKPIFWVCDMSTGIPSVHTMSTPNEWNLVSLVMYREKVKDVEEETKQE